MKPLVMVLGVLSAVLIIAQLVMGQLIATGQHVEKLVKAHQHSGYMTVLFSLAYIVLSLMMVASMPKPKPGSRHGD